MSWDTEKYDEVSRCACQNGRVVKHCYFEMDDWNRTRGGVLDVEIECPECKKKYHIEKTTKHYFELPWRGNGIIEKYYLVPNGLTIPSSLSETEKFYTTIDEKIVSIYTRNEIEEVIDDMICNKYSTRVQLKSSRGIIAIYEKCYRRKSLKEIIPFLKKIINNYDQYHWTPEKIKEYKQLEKGKIKENQNEIKKVLSKCYELHFHKG